MDQNQEPNGWYSQEAATFGDRLAGARDAAGLDQKKLARHLGVKLKTVIAWEDDTAEPRANKLQMLSGLLNVSMRWLLTGEGDGLSEPDTDPIPEDMTRLLTELREIRSQSAALTERIGRVEKRLRAKLRDLP